MRDHAALRDAEAHPLQHRLVVVHVHERPLLVREGDAGKLERELVGEERGACASERRVSVRVSFAESVNLEIPCQLTNAEAVMAE